MVFSSTGDDAEALARMRANVEFNWSPLANTAPTYERDEEVQFALRNLGPNQTMADLTPVQVHPELHRMFGGDVSNMNIYRWSRLGSRCGFSPSHCRELVLVANRCRAEAIRICRDATTAPQTRRKLLRWAERSRLTALAPSSALRLVEELGWFFQHHPGTSRSMLEALRRACVSGGGNHLEQQRRHVLRQALQSDLGDILASNEPWTTDVPRAFVLSFAARERPRGYQPPQLDTPFVVVRSEVPSVVVRVSPQRRNKRRHFVFNVEGLVVPAAALAVQQARHLDRRKKNGEEPTLSRLFRVPPEIAHDFRRFALEAQFEIGNPANVESFHACLRQVQRRVRANLRQPGAAVHFGPGRQFSFFGAPHGSESESSSDSSDSGDDLLPPPPPQPLLAAPRPRPQGAEEDFRPQAFVGRAEPHAPSSRRDVALVNAHLSREDRLPVVLANRNLRNASPPPDPVPFQRPPARQAPLSTEGPRAPHSPLRRSSFSRPARQHTPPPSPTDGFVKRSRGGAGAKKSKRKRPETPDAPQKAPRPSTPQQPVEDQGLSDAELPDVHPGGPVAAAAGATASSPVSSICLTPPSPVLEEPVLFENPNMAGGRYGKIFKRPPTPRPGTPVVSPPEGSYRGTKEGRWLERGELKTLSLTHAELVEPKDGARLWVCTSDAAPARTEEGCGWVSPAGHVLCIRCHRGHQPKPRVPRFKWIGKLNSKFAADYNRRTWLERFGEEPFEEDGCIRYGVERDWEFDDGFWRNKRKKKDSDNCLQMLKERVHWREEKEFEKKVKREKNEVKKVVRAKGMVNVWKEDGRLNKKVEKEAAFPEFEGSLKQQWEVSAKTHREKVQDHQRWWMRLPDHPVEPSNDSSSNSSSDSEALV